MQQLRVLASTIVLAGANLVPLYGVLYLNWDPSNLVLSYYFEFYIVGFFTVLKLLINESGIPWGESTALRDTYSMVLAYGDNELDWSFYGPRLGHEREDTVGYFIFHYGATCLVASLLFALHTLASWKINHTRVEDLFFTTVRYSLPGIVASHGFSFLVNYLIGGEYTRVSRQQVFANAFHNGSLLLPLVVLSIVFPLTLNAGFGVAAWAYALLVLVKIVLDIARHHREHAH